MNKIEPKFSLDALDQAARKVSVDAIGVAASKTQVGGDHYEKMAIQPMDYSMANKLDPLQHTTVKYVSRFRDKGTPLEDLYKARHCVDMLIEWVEKHEMD